MTLQTAPLGQDFWQLHMDWKQVALPPRMELQKVDLIKGEVAMKYDDAVTSVRIEAQRGLSVDSAVVLLRNAGLTITESIRALMEIFGMSLGKAKEVTAGHPVWTDVAKAARPLHDDLETVARKGGGEP